MQVLGNRIAHAVFSNQPYCFLSGGIADLSFDIQSRIFAGFFRLLGNIVHQIMDMKHISAGKNTGYTGFQAFIYVGAGGDGTHIHTQLSGQFIFRDQPHGKQKRVTGDIFLRTRNGFPLFIHLSQGHALHSFLSVDIHHGSTELQGNAEIIQTLHDISLQAAGIGHQLRNHLDLRPFQGHTPGHDKADVTGAQDDNFLSRHKSVHIDKALGRPSGINARRTVARDIQRPSRPFPAAHGEDDGFGSKRHQAVLPVHRRHCFFRSVIGSRRDIQNHGVQLAGNSQFLYLSNKTGCIFRPRQLLLKGMEAEAVVDTLVQNAAQLVIPFQNQDFINTVFTGGDCGSQARRPSPDNNQIIISHSKPFRIFHALYKFLGGAGEKI